MTEPVPGVLTGSGLSELGRVPSLREYEKLSQGRQDLPSAATLRKRPGSWSMLAVQLVEGGASDGV